MVSTSTQYPSRTGKKLHRIAFEPAGAPVGGVMLVHGLGDHIGRYDEIGALFAARGLVAVGVDFPGHGRSPGIRGHIRGWDEVETIFRESIAHLRSRVGEEAPLGMMAHSMGAFAGLRFLQIAPDVFRFAWLSSPLVKVGVHRGPVVQTFTRLLAKFAPFVTIDSGVRPEDCRPIGEEKGDDEEPDPLLHYRISVAWGAACLNLEDEVAKGVARLDPRLKLLITHGKKDVVCPAEYSRALYDSLKLPEKEYALIEGMLHEPFRGERRRVEVLARAGAWLDGMGYSLV